MRRPLLIATALLAALPAGAAAHGVGRPATHGPDPAAVERGGQRAPRAGAATGRRAGASSRLPARWCGAARAGDDTQHELRNGAHRFHAVYAHPSDSGSRLRAVADGMQSSALAASDLIEALRGRAIRFDMGTSCGQAYLDISVLRLPQTTAELSRLARTPEGTLDAVADALDAAGFGVIRGGDSPPEAAARTRNWVVWLDGPAPDGACGQAMLYDDPTRHAGNPNNLGGKVAVIFRDGGAGFCGANTVRHEIAHNLGAVVSGSPHASGGHCTDAIEDTMCLPGSPRMADGAYHARFFDYGSDDYWDPPGGGLPWWTVNLNRFLCSRADCNVPPGFSAQASDRGERPEDLRASADAERYRRGRWRLRIRVRGSGRALVSVSCRRPGERRNAVVWRRETDAPDRMGLRVKCASYPRTKVEEPDAVYALARTKRYAAGRWRVEIRVRGDQDAEVVLRCRRRRGARARIIWRRERVRAPRSYRMRVRCASLPRASARPD